MIKPKMLRKGDKIAIVSLSWGGLGDKNLIHKYYIAKERLENDFGLEVITMPNALKGTKYIYNHPEKRAEDLMNAFKDESIRGIFCAIGGDDTIRLDRGEEYNEPGVKSVVDDSDGCLVKVRADVISFFEDQFIIAISI